MAGAEETDDPTAARGMARDGRMLVAGETCWRIETADRFSVIIDAAEYYRIVKSAMLEARRSILLIGWDFDTRITFEPEGRTIDGPNRVGRFLNWLVRRSPELEIHLLKWDLGILMNLTRGATPFFILRWLSSRRVHFRLDSHHPLGAAHHQKIVVIDDAIAFCGGIDITDARWDTVAHRDRDPGRRHPWGRRYGPWHDAATAVSGPAAKALGDLARARWHTALDETIAPPPPRSAIWPRQMTEIAGGLPVGIARTLPDMPDQRGIYEIEALYLAGIRAARHTLYLESQYFASRRIAEALAARLAEPDGPEVVVVNPYSADGWLEEITMDSARAVLSALVRQADHRDRFRIYYPVTREGVPIYVHTKLMVVDDRLLRIGSSNLNNRSMGFDSECDLAIEAEQCVGQEAEICAVVINVRNTLLAEHLGCDIDAVTQAIARTDSLIGAIEALRGPGRSLVPLQTGEVGPLTDLLGENDLTNPERTQSYWRRLKRRARRPRPTLAPGRR